MTRKSSLIKNIVCSNLRRLRSPYKITLAVTYKCNLKCEICKIWKRAPSPEMDIAAIERVFKSLENLNWLDLTGGEITLREDILDIVKVILKNSRHLSIFHVSTNGQFPGTMELIAKEVQKYPVAPIINVSLDGPREVHDWLRGIPGAYEKSIETFVRLRKLAPGRCFLSCTLSRRNLEYIDIMLENLPKDISGFDFTNLHFNLFHSSSHYYNNEEVDGVFGSDLAAIQKYLSLCRKGNLVKVFLENEYLKELSRYLNGERFPVKCQALNATCFIDPSGIIFPCGMYGEPVGKLAENNYDFKRLWNDPNTFVIINKIDEKKCPGCCSPCEAYPAILGCVVKRFLKS